jgi:transposase-like protein
VLIHDADREGLNERTVARIADQVIAALREDLQAMAAQLSDHPTVGEQLTVDQVARRLGVARSTVYAHWRQWGGYKVGSGERAPIRFDAAALPIGPSVAVEPEALALQPARRHTRHRRARRDLIKDAPRLAHPRQHGS